MKNKEYSEGGFKTVNPKLFTEEYEDDGKKITSNIGLEMGEGILRDVKNLQNTETSNCIFVQYGRIAQIEAQAQTLLEQCKAAKKLLNEIEG